MSEWLSILLDALEQEWGGRPTIAALATADSKSHPHVRYVLCRRIDPDGAIWITSDSRSAKNQHIRSNPSVGLALWLPSKRQQFRIAATATIEPENKEIWREMPGLSRGMFFWPSPGEPRRAEQEFPSSSSDSSPPDTFEVLRLIPEQVEHLDLSPHPHRRRRWRCSTDWALEELNP